MPPLQETNGDMQVLNPRLVEEMDFIAHFRDGTITMLAYGVDLTIEDEYFVGLLANASSQALSLPYGTKATIKFKHIPQDSIDKEEVREWMNDQNEQWKRQKPSSETLTDSDDT